MNISTQNEIDDYFRKKERERMKEYYKKNKERITQKKRERYHNDAEYREKIKSEHREWYHRKKSRKDDNKC